MVKPFESSERFDPRLNTVRDLLDALLVDHL